MCCDIGSCEMRTYLFLVSAVIGKSCVHRARMQGDLMCRQCYDRSGASIVPIPLPWGVCCSAVAVFLSSYIGPGDKRDSVSSTYVLLVFCVQCLLNTNTTFF